MKVSVVMTTYNHEGFIAQAVDSALMQEVDFEYEILIIEDCSTDRTREIVIDFQRKHPDKIKLILSEVNKNDSRSFAQAIETSRSRYIACLEGDDYWTSPHKLQKQVEFLDNHPECATCFHNVLAIWEDGRQPSRNHNPADQSKISDMEDILASNFIATNSVMFRKGLFGEFPSWFFSSPIGDWPIHILNTEQGKIGYIDEIMGVYRIHTGGLWNRLNSKERLETIIRFYNAMNVSLDFKYNKIIKVHLSNSWYKLAGEHEYHGDLTYAKTCIKNCFIEQPFNKLIPLGSVLKTWLRIYAKTLLRWNKQELF